MGDFVRRIAGYAGYNGRVAHVRQRSLDLASGVLDAFVGESKRVDESFVAPVAHEARLGIAGARRLGDGAAGDVAEAERG